MKTIKDLDLKDKNILVRVDYNVPLKNGEVASDLRIRASLPTINYLLENGASKIILISHLGRPEGKEKPEFSLAPVSKALQKLLPNQKIDFKALPENGEKIESKAKILLLENLRFDPGEETNSKDFIKNIVDSVDAEIFVQDGFAVIHRTHASTDAIKDFLPTYGGLLLKKEVESLKKVLENPKHPVVLLIGGSKVEDKQPLIDKFLGLADHILVGGKIAADGYKPIDGKILVATDFDENSEGAKLDIGPVSTAEFAKILGTAKTIIWNGVMGKVEDPAFTTASAILADVIGKNIDATTIICGGDTTSFVENYLQDHPDLKYTLISTGGGASLEFLLGKDLPGLKIIQK